MKKWTWSSHVPLNKLLLCFFVPEFIIELGAGAYSTNLFVNYNAKKFICIENSLSWIERMKKVGPDKDYEILHHDLGKDIKRSTNFNDISEEKMWEIATYYGSLLFDNVLKSSLFPKLLFVDNYSCCRRLAINILSRGFDIVHCHDACPGTFKNIYGNFLDYFLIENFNGYCLRTEQNCSFVFLKNILEYDESLFIKSIEPFVNEFIDTHGLERGSISFRKVSLERLIEK